MVQKVTILHLTLFFIAHFSVIFEFFEQLLKDPTPKPAARNIAIQSYHVKIMADWLLIDLLCEHDI